MKQGFIKKVLAVACAGAIMGSTLVMGGCGKLNDDIDVYAIIKETESVYVMHKAKSNMSFQEDFADFNGFTTSCGYFTAVEGGHFSHGPYIVHEEKGIVLSDVEYRIYKNLEDVEKSHFAHNVVECEECFAE